MSKKASVFANSLLYTSGNLLLKAFSFFLIPVYTAYLSTEQYGVVNLASGFYGLAGSLLTLALQYAVIRFYADWKEDRQKVARMFGTVICFVLLLGGAFCLLSLLMGDLLAQWFFKGIPFFPVVLLSVVISVVSGVYAVYQDILKGMQNAKASVILSYVYFFTMLGCNIITVVKLGMGANGVLISALAANLLMVLLMFIDLLRKKLMVFCVDGKILRELLRYSVPLVPHTVAFHLQTYVTKLIINEKLSLSVLGIYSLASQFGMVADVVLNSVQSAFQPWLFGELNKNSKDSDANIGSITYMLMWVYGLIFILIGVFSQEAVIIMASRKEYVVGWMYVPAIVLTVALKSPLYFYNNFLYYDKSKTKYVFVSTLVACGINIFFTWLLTPVLQVYGSILADVIAMVVRFAIAYCIVRREAGKVYSLLKMEGLALLPMLFMGAALIPAFTRYQEVLSIRNIAFKLLVVALYAGLAAYVNRQGIRAVLQRVKARRRG